MSFASPLRIIGPSLNSTRVATVRGYEARDLEACRGLWVELTQKHRDIFDSPEIGGDDPCQRLRRAPRRRSAPPTSGSLS